MNDAMRESLTIDAFERHAVDFSQFDHEAHVYIAWLYLQELDVTAAIARMSSTLQSVVEELGVPGKFHATITWFYMLIISERRQFHGCRDWHEFREANRDLLSRDENALWRYYRPETLASDAARRSFVLPDRLEG